MMDVQHKCSRCGQPGYAHGNYSDCITYLKTRIALTDSSAFAANIRAEAAEAEVARLTVELKATSAATENESIRDYERWMAVMMAAANSVGIEVENGESPLDLLVAEVARLTARVAELEAAATWPPVTEPPPADGVYLAYDEVDGVQIADYRAGMWFDCDRLPAAPTHWQPLPAPPQE